MDRLDEGTCIDEILKQNYVDKDIKAYLAAFEKGNDQGNHKKMIFVVILRFKLSNYLCVT